MIFIVLGSFAALKDRGLLSSRDRQSDPIPPQQPPSEPSVTENETTIEPDIAADKPEIAGPLRIREEEQLWAVVADVCPVGTPKYNTGVSAVFWSVVLCEIYFFLSDERVTDDEFHSVARYAGRKVLERSGLKYHLDELPGKTIFHVSWENVRADREMLDGMFKKPVDNYLRSAQRDAATFTNEEKLEMGRLMSNPDDIVLTHREVIQELQRLRREGPTGLNTRGAPIEEIYTLPANYRELLAEEERSKKTSLLDLYNRFKQVIGPVADQSQKADTSKNSTAKIPASNQKDRPVFANTISGVLVHRNGRPVTDKVELRLHDTSATSFLYPGRTRTGTDGKFKFNVVPGQPCKIEIQGKTVWEGRAGAEPNLRIQLND